MHYIDLINSFWDLATINPLPTGQVSLYFALLHICNRSYWAEWFQAPNQVLSVLAGLSRSGILKARNELKQRGLIDFKERGTKSTLYKIVMQDSIQTDVLMSNSKQVCAQVGVQNSAQYGNQVSMQDSTQTDVLVLNSKQVCAQESTQAKYSIYNNINNKRQKTKDIPPISPLERFEDFWEAFPNKKRRALTEKAYCDLILSGTVTEDVLVECAKNYARYIQDTGDKMYLPNNFLEKCIFEDFIPESGMEEGCINTRSSHVESSADSREELVGDDWMEFGEGWRDGDV